MKKNQKNILIISFLVLIIIICSFYLSSYLNINRQGRLEQPLSIVNVELSPQIEAKPLSEATSRKAEVKKEKTVIVNVLNQKYTTTINNNNSVYEVMENLQKNKENNFSFNYKEYPTLGIFIDEINKTRGENGKYWIYFVNEKEASVGVSKYIIKDGDVIKWELK